MNDLTVKAFEGTPSLTPDKIQHIRDWYRAAVSLHNTSSAPTLSAFYDGYAAASMDILQELYHTVEEMGSDVAETVKKTHGFRNKFLFVIVVGGGVVVYKRYKNGVLLSSQKEKNRE